MNPRQHESGPKGESSTVDSSDTSQHLSSIDNLLSAAYELMKRTPTIDGAAFEQLRQLRVKIRRTLRAGDSDDFEPLPKIAPELYKDRPDGEGAIEFTKRVYSPWLGKNLCRSDIQKLDVKLYNALYNLEDPTKEFREIGLLTKKELNDKLLASAKDLKASSTSLTGLDLSPAELERTRLYNLARRRRQRPPKK